MTYKHMNPQLDSYHAKNAEIREEEETSSLPSEANVSLNAVELHTSSQVGAYTVEAPNEVTLDAICDAMTGNDVVVFASADQLLDDLFSE